MTLKFQYAGDAIQGGRRYQEDCAAVWSGDAASAAAADAAPRDGGSQQPVPCLVGVLADGMGGHAGGAVASRTACDMFLQDLRGRPGEAPAVRLAEGLAAANDALSAKVAAQPEMSGMGCTLVGATFGPEGLSWISVGDSLLYLWRAGVLRRLNADHSLAPEIDKLADAGKITRQEAAADPRRHYLRSALTGDDLDMIDLSPGPLPLEPGDIVVIASDGIHTLAEPDIEAAISAHTDAGPERLASLLLSWVEAAGAEYQDNTTVIVVRVQG